MNSFVTNSSVNPRGIKYGLVAGIFYFLVAFIANWNHPLDIKILSSSTHGFICFFMTFLSTTLMEYFFNKFSLLHTKYLGSVILSGMISLIIIISAHLIISTPNIVNTVLASALMSMPYYLLFPLKLLFEEEAKSDKFIYRLDQNWKTREWVVKKIATPYYLRDLFKVIMLNIIGPSKKNTEEIYYIERKFNLSKEKTRVKIAFLGDLMPTYGLDWKVDKELLFKIRECDYLICNLEGLFEVEEKVLLGQYHQEKFLIQLKDILPAERIILSVANNHSADGGINVFNNTIKKLKSHGFKVIGSRENPSIIINGSINLVAATQWSNQSHGYLSFLEFSNEYIDPTKINILYPHWGYEMELFPNQKWEQKTHELLNDWDHIIGHHSHLPGPVSLKTSKGKEQLVVYSLGDAATGLIRPVYRHGAVLFVEFDETKLLRGEWSFTRLYKENENIVLREVQDCKLLTGVKYEK